MMERVLLQDFSVLIVCPSPKWSTIERRAIFDCTYLRDIGGNPVILCLKGSQVDKEADNEDIPRIYIKKSKVNSKLKLGLYLEFKKALRYKDFDIVHCYQLNTAWMACLILKSKQRISIFYTLNQHLKKVYHGFFSKWWLKRLDAIFTLSKETQEYARENFYFSYKKIKNLGTGIDILPSSHDFDTKVKSIGCIINNYSELNRINKVIKTFRILKSKNKGNLDHLNLSLFLGPRIYQKDRAKKVLKDLDYEFYEGDIFLYSLTSKKSELKKLDVLLGISFDEPINDYEISSLIYSIPVLFPRTASRQSLLFRYGMVGESYMLDDVREAQSKLSLIINNYLNYLDCLEREANEICASHGVESYSEVLRLSYEKSFQKRQRFSNIK
jgi:hypothetical protein